MATALVDYKKTKLGSDRLVSDLEPPTMVERGSESDLYAIVIDHITPVDYDQAIAYFYQPDSMRIARHLRHSRDIDDDRNIVSAAAIVTAESIDVNVRPSRSNPEPYMVDDAFLFTLIYEDPGREIPGNAFLAYLMIPINEAVCFGHTDGRFYATLPRTRVVFEGIHDEPFPRLIIPNSSLGPGMQQESTLERDEGDDHFSRYVGIYCNKIADTLVHRIRELKLPSFQSLEELGGPEKGLGKKYQQYGTFHLSMLDLSDFC